MISTVYSSHEASLHLIRAEEPDIAQVTYEEFRTTGGKMREESFAWAESEGQTNWIAARLHQMNSLCGSMDLAEPECQAGKSHHFVYYVGGAPVAAVSAFDSKNWLRISLMLAHPGGKDAAATLLERMVWLSNDLGYQGRVEAFASSDAVVKVVEAAGFTRELSARNSSMVDFDSENASADRTISDDSHTMSEDESGDMAYISKNHPDLYGELMELDPADSSCWRIEAGRWRLSAFSSGAKFLR